MASAPLNWLLKIGGAALKTTAQTLSEAVNWLYDKVIAIDAALNTKADIAAISSLTEDKLNISDLLTLEEIEASTDLNGKGAAAESIRDLSENLKTYYDEDEDTLYIQGGTSEYVYDSDTEILYIG